METAKEKAIREAYGEYWNYLKKHITDFGYVYQGKIMADIRFSYHDIVKDLDLVRRGNNMIPKVLVDIEANNGWIRIESEDDLPKKLGEYDFIYDNRIVRMGFDPKFEDLKNCARVYSHWKPLEKTKLPIF